MASLKEIKTRISSIQSTEKITSAMRMVASAKLHKAQQVLEGMLPYQSQLNHIMSNFLNGGVVIDSPFLELREVKRVAVVAFSSNSSLCGAFNANVIRKTLQVLGDYESLGRENVLIYTVGRKVGDAIRKAGYTVTGNYDQLSEKPEYKGSRELADELKKLFLSRQVDRVEMIYYHFKSTGSQTLMQEAYLPLSFELEGDSVYSDDYIIEPSQDELIARLIPAVLNQRMFTVLMDSNTSEHAIRMMAMQIATENADQLIQELKLQYNKVRQQAITSELLDIVGGSMR